MNSTEILELWQVYRRTLLKYREKEFPTLLSYEKENPTVAYAEETKAADVATENVNSDVVGNVEVSAPETVAYTHVDVRL